MALPNGDSVMIGAEGAGLLLAFDTGRLEAVLWQLVDEGRPNDAIAVLAYVARHRGQAAAALAVMGLRIVTDLQDTTGAGVLVAAILQESGADPSVVEAAVRDAGLPADFAAAAAVAALEPASESLPNDAAAPLAPEPLAAEATESDGPSFGARGGERGGFGNGLPPGLTIGGGGGAAAEVKDPPADGGVSG